MRSRGTATMSLIIDCNIDLLLCTATPITLFRIRISAKRRAAVMRGFLALSRWPGAALPSTCCRVPLRTGALGMRARRPLRCRVVATLLRQLSGLGRLEEAERSGLGMGIALLSKQRRRARLGSTARFVATRCGRFKQNACLCCLSVCGRFVVGGRRELGAGRGHLSGRARIALRPGCTALKRARSCLPSSWLPPNQVRLPSSITLGRMSRV
mmetsp:Transcript_37191/g.77785  ORF Transcript_37191/g.77785 Transcript_37191/m.77785 type:complete len:212 (+) Transcript_37191:727-1362(+)